MKDKIVILFLFVLLLIVSVGFAYYYGTQQAKNVAVTGETPARGDLLIPEIAVEEPVNVPPAVESGEQPAVPEGWITYTNLEYGFEISYPPSYEALTDEENLYGWPNGIVLLYGGGQSYDLAVEHWDTQAEYEAKYGGQPNVTALTVGDAYITLLNTNFEPEVDEIIGTFRTIPSGE